MIKTAGPGRFGPAPGAPMGSGVALLQPAAVTRPESSSLQAGFSVCLRLCLLLLSLTLPGCTVIHTAAREETRSDEVRHPMVVAVRPDDAVTEMQSAAREASRTGRGGRTPRRSSAEPVIGGREVAVAEMATHVVARSPSSAVAQAVVRDTRRMPTDPLEQSFPQEEDRLEAASDWRPTRRSRIGVAGTPLSRGQAAETAVFQRSGEQPRSPPTGGADIPHVRAEPLELDVVLESVDRAFPLLDAARALRDIAEGQHLAAHGAFDLKVKAASENGPLGFYETYRHRVGLEQPTYWGGSVFAGYRIGRGSFQPWYLERLTDEGGEFNGGIIVPLLRNVGIDTRRAELWKTNLGRQIAAAEFRLQRIGFVRDASYAYWDWVAAGRRVRISQRLLALARNRNEGIRRKVETGAIDPPVLADNQRLIASREAKLLAERRKLQETAVKLSLYYRDADGRPVVPTADQIPEFPEVTDSITDRLDEHLRTAQQNRPELQILGSLREQLEIDRRQALNETRPDLSVAVRTAKDVGPHASSKRDKRPFELEAGVFFEVPVQRRKARGKLAAAEAKIRQVLAKRTMMSDKVAAEVQAVHARLRAALGRIDQVREARRLAERLADVERRRFELGNSDLLAVNLREQQAAQAQIAEVEVLHEYFTALADLTAVLAVDSVRAAP
ncbi:MAG: TolC family protein [Planctomycetota bacterium]|nr:MAG: TolC family protein [Planctomycetota bacterium]